MLSFAIYWYHNLSCRYLCCISSNFKCLMLFQSLRWLWAYAPKTRKYGFIPKAYARPPAMTSLWRLSLQVGIAQTNEDIVLLLQDQSLRRCDSCFRKMPFEIMSLWMQTCNKASVYFTQSILSIHMIPKSGHFHLNMPAASSCSWVDK